MKSTNVSFENAQGERLAAKLDLPVGEHPRACAIFAHCFTCNKNFLAARNISLALTQKGVAVLRFDFTGLGQSEGDFADTNFSSNVDDLIAAAAFMEEQIGAPEILVGHSLGGAAVLLAGLKIDSVKAVATVGAPADPVHVTHLLQEGENEIEVAGEATVDIGGRPFKIKRQFINDLKALTGSEHIRKLKKALLVLHSPQDNTVGIENARLIYDAAMHPKSFITLDGADHLLSHKEDAIYVGHMIASWAVRYIPAPEEKDPLVTERQVAVRTGPKGYTTEIVAGNHHLIADEPPSVGGSDLGPTPYGYLLASLGACTSMTLRMYANNKGWDLQEARVHLTHGKDYVDDCVNCEEKPVKMDVIQREVELEGDLTQEQRNRLMEIADRCPVHRTLSSEINIRTSEKV
ncbi:MAG: bifunctional alpha/beta hydrolase/OsmC family protein [Bacteroidota bacterium]